MANVNYQVTNLKTSLTTGLTSGGSETTIDLASLTTTDGHALVMADLGDIGYIVINPRGETMEICSFTGITSSQLTGVTRGLAFYGSALTAVTANKKAHSPGETVIFSNNHQVFVSLKSYIDGIATAGTVDSSSTVKGVVEMATQAEIDAGTVNGGTGAKLVTGPDQLALSTYATQLPSSGQKAALAGSTGTPSATNAYVTVAGQTAEPDQTQTTTNTTYAVGEANATTKHSIVANSFTAAMTSIRGAKLWKIADTGSFTGTVKVSLQANNAGSPSGSDLASGTITNAAWLKLNAAAEFAVAFSSEYTSMTVGSTYWIVITPSTSDNSNHPNLGYDNASAHGLVLKYNNSTDGWVLTSTACLYFKTSAGILNKAIRADSTTGLVPAIIRPYSLVALSTTGVANSSTSETVVMSTQVEGGFFTANSGLKVTMDGNMLDNGATYTIKIKYNGSVLASLSETNSGNATEYFTFVAHILNQGSVSSQKFTGILHGGISFIYNTAVGTISHNTPTNGTSAIDLSGPGLIEITVQISSTASSQQISFINGIIEKIG